MSKAADYRRQAAQIEAMAKLISRQDHRDHILSQARALRRLADEAELDQANEANAVD